MLESYYKSQDKKFTLIQDDVLEVLPKFKFEFDMVFADPPYFLSNDLFVQRYYTGSNSYSYLRFC